MRIVIPDHVQYIINKLTNAGYKAYVVGGCVRDSILGRVPNDWDMTTDCVPEQMLEVFEDNTIIPTGLKHGTVTVLVDSLPVEITTFRIDGKYTDNRRPDEVKYTTSLTEDLARRDFTINAMAYNYQEGLIDPFGGYFDLHSQIIKCVGNPNERFNEDALRMLRAVRFKAQLGFEIEKHTWRAIHDNHDLIKNISVERITQEINKILLANPLAMYAADHFKLLKYVFPELDVCFWTNQDNPYHCYSVGQHLIHSSAAIEDKLYLRLTMMLHDIAKPKCNTTDELGIDHFYGHTEESTDMALDILKRMRYDNYTIMRVRDLILHHDSEIQDDKRSVRRWLNKIGEETFRDLLKVKEADIKAQNLLYYQDRHDKLERIKIILDEVIKDNECFSKKDLAINGSDLIKMGYLEGRQIGLIIDKLVEMVIDCPDLNTKEQLLAMAQKLK